MDKNKVGTMMQSAAKVPISELNECITCKLCRGYYIDATTIIECLHTFCRSCIVRYLESNKYCPICDVQVHKTKPLLNLRPDKTIQDLVYKLVPRLYQNEIQRRKSFYETHPEGKPTAAEETAESLYDYILAPEESVNLTLNYYGCCTAPRYLRCPSAVLITHLKKLIRAKYELTEHHRVEVFYNQDCLNPTFSLMDISYIYSWKRKDPVDLTYKIYECRAKKPKLDTTSENNVNNSTNNNNNNNNWKEVQLRISENGEMSITGIEDSSMLELLDATENFQSEIVINEGKNLENFPKPIQVDAEIGNSEVKIQAKRSVSAVKAPENAPNSVKQPENAQKPVENHLATPKKELPGLKFIGKSSSSSSTTSTLTSTKSSSVGSRMANSAAKTGTSTSKTANSGNKTNSEAKKPPTCTEASSNIKTSSSATSTKSSSSKPAKPFPDNKLPKNLMCHAMPKSMELSATLNLNSELSVIPLSASTSCVSLSSCGGTTTVFSTINKSMCSTRMESGDSQNSGGGGDRSQGFGINSKDGHTEHEKEPLVNNIPKETKNLKRKCEEDGKTLEVPAKLPKPTILNHSIGLMNLSNNHPLKKHSKMNRNGEHLLRTPDLSEKIPISTPTLTVNHVTVPQKHISMDSTPSKPIIINKNVSSLQINKPGTPKSGQRGGHGGNAPCYANKSLYNSVGGGKLGERNGEKMEGTQGKTEVLNSSVNSMAKPSVLFPAHHTQSYQTSHHTPIITPSQLPHHHNLNSLQSKPPACSNLTHSQEKTAQCQGNATSQSNTATSQVNTSTSQSNAASLASLKTTTSVPSVTCQSNITLTSQKRSDIPPESSQCPNKLSVQATPLHAATNHSLHADALSCAPSPIPLSPATPTNHAPASIKTKPSTPIGYKTLRDPPKSWNSQINSQIARVNQNVKAQQLANAAAAASQGGGANAQGRFAGDLKSVRPAKFFKGRNMPRYLGCPVSGVKPMYQVQPNAEKEKNQEQQIVHAQQPIGGKAEKSEIKKHSIVKIDPKTLRPISEKAPETSNLSNISSSLALNASQNNQELRINSSAGDLKINTSSVSIFNPLKLQSSPKSERKSPKSPHSPKVKSSPNGNNASAVTTNTTSSSPSPSNTLSPKQHRDKTNLTFTPPNPFVPNLGSPTLSPNQFLYPAGGFPSYDPRVMAAYHSLWYTQRMAAAAAAGFVPPPMPHAFGMNMGLNTATTTIGQQQHNPGIAPKHSTPPKITGQPSPRGANATPAQIPKSSPTAANKKTKETTAKSEKSLETALNKLSQSKAKELGNNKQQQSGGKKVGGTKEPVGQNHVTVDAHRSASPKVSGASKISSDPQQRVSSRVLGGSKKSGGSNFTPQQNRTLLKDAARSNSTMSALEKLSQNKAIEILGGDGRNSPMGGHKPVLGGTRLVEGKDETLKGTTLPLATEKQLLPSETTKRQSFSATEINDSRQTKIEKDTECSTSSEDPPKSIQIRHQMEEVPTQTPTASEHKTVSAELQTRLGQATSNDSDKTVEHKLSQGQIKSDQSENRVDQNQNRPDPGHGGSPETNRNVLSAERCESTQGDGQKDAGTDPKVTSSDKTDPVDANNDKKQSVIGSDIKPSSSQNSVELTQNPSAINAVNPSGNDALTEDPSGNVANQVSVGNVASGESQGPVTLGNSAEGEAPLVAGDKSGNGENRTDGVTASDKGGGEKK